jgi:hypothetical protein
LNPGHFRDVIVIQALRMIAYQIENLFLVCHAPNIPSKETTILNFSLFYPINVYKNQLTGSFDCLK